VKPGSKEAAELSHRIRSKLKQLREDAMKLQSINKQEEKKVWRILFNRPLNTDIEKDGY
jgi:hypothetical protein